MSIVADFVRRAACRPYRRSSRIDPPFTKQRIAPYFEDAILSGIGTFGLGRATVTKRKLNPLVAVVFDNYQACGGLLAVAARLKIIKEPA